MAMAVVLKLTLRLGVIHSSCSIAGDLTTLTLEPTGTWTFCQTLDRCRASFLSVAATTMTMREERH